MSKNKYIEKKELIILVGGLVIVILCILSVAFLMYHSIKSQQTLPEYYITIFASIATLIIGYILGNQKNG